MKKLILSASLVCSFIFAGLCQNLNSGLVAYFPLDGNADDHSTINIDGVTYNTLPTTGINGNPNGALSFNGVNSFVDCGTDNRSITNDLTLSFWVRTTDPSVQVFIGKYESAVDRGYISSYDPMKPRLAGRNQDNTFQECVSNVSIHDGNWHHVLCTIEGAVWKIYVDCNLEQTLNTGSTNPAVYNSDTLTLGKQSISNTLFFNGDMDEVRIYNRVLDSFERDSLCNNLNSTASLDELTVNQNFDVHIYPNPARDVVYTTSTKQIIGKIEIYDQSGRLVITKTENLEKLDVSQLDKGTYILRAYSNDLKSTSVKRFVKL